MEDRLTARIALIGLSGAGKSEVAFRVAERLGFEAVDLDERVERAAGTSVASLIDSRGEVAFRALESAALRDALGAPESGGHLDTMGSVLALGAGILTSEEHRSLLRERAFVVWLQVKPETAARRIGEAGAEARPLVREAPERRLRDLLVARGDAYRAAAHSVIDTEGRTPAQVADAVVAAWEAWPRWGSSAS
jgi:shikimate kinase